MKTLIKPKALKPGDKVATISLSWGGAGEFPYRYQTGKKQLEDNFKVEVIETKNALKSADWLNKNPQARADDLMEAFSDNSIKAIITNIGGEDSVRILPYLDLSIITKNPKIFLGFSDSTITHLTCYKAGLSSFYGTSILVGFAENGGMLEYQIDDIKKTLFSSEPIGQILPNSKGWTSERLEWTDKSLANKKRELTPNNGWNFLQGKTKVQGKLIGGCLEVLEFLKSTEYWFQPSDWEDSILFLETSEVMMPPMNFKWIIWNYAAQGVFHKIKAVILGRPYNNQFTKEYNKILLQIIRDELQLTELPIVTEMNFGHTSPTFTIPYGLNAEINCKEKSFSIIENGVID
ncbi:S66 family peptidase [Flavobacterium psychrophilum]|uniref:S66 family peptidase n=1 Tax=Flavobacterium psychrophilum TaxID=96345 RepID=UPI000B7C3456|nr:S66 peptidase family protein [Flavobacterium psychrophilum]EKT4501385.1 LD-carboxypeptidase [Flavobacterium psychrophilum]MBF2023899.1 LD-carboxypeptidase [Flavobacterium psychrophilum]MCB5984273.1 LD-carboxypeptidase [Flavobacterium psychrophilum]MCB5994489.1 LD-carboxypeptidase [Flavobacterium psychrophilum]MCB5996627.1 LD-carboxypeptidase [Flavobacterium psychrophilum]